MHRPYLQRLQVAESFVTVVDKQGKKGPSGGGLQKGPHFFFVFGERWKMHKTQDTPERGILRSDTLERWQVFDKKRTPLSGLFTLRRDAARLPSKGVTHDFFLIESPHWVNIVPITEKGTIVLVRQHRLGSDRVELEIRERRGRSGRQGSAFCREAGIGRRDGPIDRRSGI